MNIADGIYRDIDKIREGIAEKVSHFLWLIMGFVICVSLSFYYGWELSLVVISYVPIVMITNAIIGKVCCIYIPYYIITYAILLGLAICLVNPLIIILCGRPFSAQLLLLLLMYVNLE